MNEKNNWYNIRKKFGFIECGKELFTYLYRILHRITSNDNVGYKIEELNYGNKMINMINASSFSIKW